MSYSAKADDTFRNIAGVVYGDPSQEEYLKAVNPGVDEPISAGVVIKTPSIAARKTGIPSNVGEDQPTITVDGTVFDQWTTVTITRTVDTVAQFAFGANFEPADKVVQQLFKPMQFAPVVISIGSEKIVDGTMIDVSPELTADDQVITVSGYARCGVLMDCHIPVGRELEFRDVTIKDVAEDVCLPFNVKPVFKASPGKVFNDFFAATTGQEIWSFLSRLCEQRTLIMTSDANGDLVFQSEASSEELFAKLVEGEPPLLSAQPQYSPQQVYSSVTAAGPVLFTSLGAENFVVNNPLLGDVFRPYVFEVRDSSGEDLETAAKTRAARMYASAAYIRVVVSGIRNAEGKLWDANQIVEVYLPSANIYKPTRMLIKQAVISIAKESALNTELTLVFPGAYSGKLPETLPWL